MFCVICEKALSGRQTKFCSKKCKNKESNNRHQGYACQKSRGLERKKKLVELKGGECSSCGYKKNYAALCFHHESDKDFGISMRECSNNSWETLLAEVEKCILLCHNCHMESHYPELVIDD